jgi:hypothetical protein
MRTLIVLVILVSLCLGGCAKDSGVILAKDSKSLFDDTICPHETSKLAEDTTGSEQYRIYQQAATGFVPLSAIRDDIERQATVYCDNGAKKLKMLKIINSPMSLGCPAKAELIFTCLPKPNAESFEDQLYIKLSNLKKLLNDGVITKDEFEQQKARILNPK